MKNKHPKLYSLFYRNRNGGRRWIRSTSISLAKIPAIKHFTNRLVEGISDPVREFRLRGIN